MEFGIIVSACVGLVGVIGGVIVRDRFIMTSIAAGDRVVQDGIDKKIESLHERVNRTRDEFVRRDDFNSHLTRVEGTVGNMHSELKDISRRIDTLIQTIVAGNGTGNN